MSATVAKSNDGRMLLTAQGTSGSGDELQMVAHRNTLAISIDSPWYGSTESGFGATLYFDLSREDAAQLAAMLNEWLAK